jgi:hypothetical protein
MILNALAGAIYFLFLSFHGTSILVSQYASLDDCNDAAQSVNAKATGKPKDVTWYCVEAERKAPVLPPSPTEKDGV